MPKISVIMPIYNSENCLSTAIESVLNQTYKNFELILIDDGSTDSSGKICDDFAANDNRIIVIHQNNGGICNARNAGLRIAKGEYISFCDNDDYMMPECLEKALLATNNSTIDVVRFYRAHFLVQNERMRCVDFHGYSTNSKTVKIDNWSAYIELINTFSYGPWAGIYKSDLIKRNKILYDERARYGLEDVDFVTRCCANAEKACFLYDTLYVWIQREKTSTSKKAGNDVYKNRFEMILKLRDFENSIEKNLHRNEKEKSQRFFDYVSMAAHECTIAVDKSNRKKYFICSKEKLLENNNVKLYPYKSLKSIIVFLCISTHRFGLLAFLEHFHQSLVKYRYIMSNLKIYN